MRIYLLLFITVVFPGLGRPGNSGKRVPEVLVREWFVHNLNEYETVTIGMLTQVSVADSLQLREGFRQLRQHYKRISFLSDRLFPYETLQWNAPALPRVEDDNPEKIIDPQGMQQLEVLLFESELDDAHRQLIKEQLQLLLSVARQVRMSAMPVMFSTNQIWQALRDVWIFIVTKGITGFDSPIAGLALQESKWQLEGVHEVLVRFKHHAIVEDEALIQKILEQTTKAIDLLNAGTDVDEFDRLVFLRDGMVPLARSLEQLALLPAFTPPRERHPIPGGRVNIFDGVPFDINFFSPNERYLPNTARVLLGKKLFADKRLSGNNKQSCAGCHVPEKGFADGLPKAIGLDGKTVLQRNTPSLWNAAFQTRQFYDMRQSLLDFQVGNVVHSTDEMGGSMHDALVKLASDEKMVKAFADAYRDEPEPMAIHTLSNAIASYVRSLVAFGSPTDDYINGQTRHIDQTLAKGFNLFTGKAGCATCHFLPAYNGLVPPRYQETEAEVLGLPATAESNLPDNDFGRYNFTGASIHKRAFKTPGLRNIALTAPYMHNGVFKTLEEVIDFYNDGGGAGKGMAIHNQTLPDNKLNLTNAEKKALIVFLQSLTDTTALCNTQ